MIEKLTEEEIEFLETYYYPIALAECLFSDFDNLSAMDDTSMAHLRACQYPLLSHEYILDDDPNLTDKQNFQLRKGAGDMWALGGRLFGKTLISEKVDLLITFCCLETEKIGFSSYDALHIRGVLEDVIHALEHHPFFKLFKPKVNRSPSYRFALKGGNVLEGVNMNLTGKNPGAQFYQKHFTRLYIEEASFETETIYKQRRDSISEIGCVYRIAGMTNFTKYSPCGQAFYDHSLRKSLVNLPQTVNPQWDENKKQQAVKDFGGEQSIGFRIFVKGEVVEEGVSVFDIQRVRQCYNENRHTKHFEVTKKTYEIFKSLIIVERPKNASSVMIFSDIGESAPTEIGIAFLVNERYKYIYNVTLYGLTDKEQFQIFKYLAEELEANIISLDCTDGTGRAIYRSLEEIFPKENLVWVAFNEKIPIDFEKDDKGNEVFKNGQPVYREEFVSEWSIKHLKDILYSKRLEIGQDYKFDMQLNSVVAMHSGTRVTYKCIAQEDHLFQAFQVFSIAHWLTEFLSLRPVAKKKFAKRGVT